MNFEVLDRRPVDADFRICGAAGIAVVIGAGGDVELQSGNSGNGVGAADDRHVELRVGGLRVACDRVVGAVVLLMGQAVVLDANGQTHAAAGQFEESAIGVHLVVVKGLQDRAADVRVGYPWNLVDGTRRVALVHRVVAEEIEGPAVGGADGRGAGLLQVLGESDLRRQLPVAGEAEVHSAGTRPQS